MKTFPRLKHFASMPPLAVFLFEAPLLAQTNGPTEWIDPDTGGPAEDNIPRLEDH